MRKSRKRNNDDNTISYIVYSCSIRLMTIAEHESKIVDILRYTWEFHRFCVKNDINFLLDEDENEEEIVAKIVETETLPDGRPLGWQNDKKFWHLMDEKKDESYR
mmetsp:Transcript_22587/g.39936  ORF Transcript_22587/g.39936 Transcript_22587/m.39936 type:complete len:105 (-) Transcript_22587:130-444(-)